MPSGGTAVVVTELFPPAVGGSATLLENVYARLTSADVVVLTDGSASGPVPYPYPAGLRIVQRPIAARSWGVLDPGAINHYVRVSREIRSVSRTRPTLVHAARALPEGVAALLCRVTTGLRYVCWCHGEDVATALGSRELTFLMRRVYALAAGIVANSQHTRNLLTEIGVDPAKVVVVRPGVDTGRFRPDVDGREARQRFAPDAEPMLLSVGRLQRRKGHDVAIEAIASLIPAFPRLRYVIVGDGAERPRLEDLVAGFGLRRHVVFAGEVSRRELPACYAACDIFVLPNRVDGRDLEGFGIVFLEAAAAGRPTIGGHSGGVAEAIEHGATGLLVDGADAGALAGAIRTLASSLDLRAQFGAAGRARVLRDFRWERAAASVADLHHRLAS